MNITARIETNPQVLISLYVTTCPTCGMVHAITRALETRRRNDGKSVYCPNGHTWVWTETEIDRQRKRAETAESALRYARAGRDAARDQARAAERSAVAYRGHLTRMRNKIAAGVCPVADCRRHFTDVLAHISTSHPGWAQDHPDALPTHG